MDSWLCKIIYTNMKYYAANIEILHNYIYMYLNVTTVEVGIQSIVFYYS